MEAQRLLHGFCSNSAIPPIQNLKTPFFMTFNSPLDHSKRWVSFKIPQTVSCSKGRLECRNSVEKAGGFTGDEKGSESGIRRKNLAVFVSGGGSNFRSIHEACLRGSVHGDIVVLVTNKSGIVAGFMHVRADNLLIHGAGCGGAEYARDKDIPVILFPKTKDEPEALSPNDLAAALRGFKVDFILLAGYLKLIPVELIRAYPKSILNIHPSLLPAFGGKGYYGMKVHKAVIASGARYSGPTVHFVDDHYDRGRILAQRVVPVLADDTADELAARVLHEEHSLYSEVTSALCAERVVWREDGVPIIQSKENPNEYN